MEKTKKEELMRMLKFFLFSCSAGIIQLGVTTLLGLIPAMPPSAAYLIGLVCSVIWNVTFNRKFTFKAATNLPKAITLALVFYIPFAPASTFLTAYLTNGDVLGLFQITHLGILGSNVPTADVPLGATILVTFICMVFNLLLEFPWQKFVVFRKPSDAKEKLEEK